VKADCLGAFGRVGQLVLAAVQISREGGEEANVPLVHNFPPVVQSSCDVCERLEGKLLRSADPLLKVKICICANDLPSPTHLQMSLSDGQIGVGKCGVAVPAERAKFFPLQQGVVKALQRGAK